MFNCFTGVIIHNGQAADVFTLILFRWLLSGMCRIHSEANYYGLVFSLGVVDGVFAIWF